jgi:hypothetical protein
MVNISRYPITIPYFLQIHLKIFLIRERKKGRKKEREREREGGRERERP